MIKLDAPFQTVASSTFNGVTTTVLTNTLFISSVRIDFNTNAMYATIQKGTVDALGSFGANLSAVEICVNPDGTFVSSDGSWSGSVTSAPALVAQLKVAFDGFILASGTVTGSVV